MAGRTRGHRRRADELTCTESEAAALKALRTATGEIDGDLERHTVRQDLIAERLADTRGIAYDRELLLCASFLHDAGLYGPASSGGVYIKDSGRYALRTLEPLGWSEERLAGLRRCVRAASRPHGAVVDAQRGRAGSPLGSRRGAAGARALWHPSVLAEARAVARGAANWLLARHTRRPPRALATDVAGHVPPAGARRDVRGRVATRPRGRAAGPATTTHRTGAPGGSGRPNSAARAVTPSRERHRWGRRRTWRPSMGRPR